MPTFTLLLKQEPYHSCSVVRIQILGNPLNERLVVNCKKFRHFSRGSGLFGEDLQNPELDPIPELENNLN